MLWSGHRYRMLHGRRDHVTRKFSKSSYKCLHMSTQTVRALHPKIAARRNSRCRVAPPSTLVNLGLTSSGPLSRAVNGLMIFVVQKRRHLV
jgi:hypothetical protein